MLHVYNINNSQQRRNSSISRQKIWYCLFDNYGYTIVYPAAVDMSITLLDTAPVLLLHCISDCGTKSTCITRYSWYCLAVARLVKACFQYCILLTSATTTAPQQIQRLTYEGTVKQWTQCWQQWSVCKIIKLAWITTTDNNSQPFAG